MDITMFFAPTPSPPEPVSASSRYTAACKAHNDYLHAECKILYDHVATVRKYMDALEDKANATNMVNIIQDKFNDIEERLHLARVAVADATEDRPATIEQLKVLEVEHKEISARYELSLRVCDAAWIKFNSLTEPEMIIAASKTNTPDAISETYMDAMLERALAKKHCDNIIALSHQVVQSQS